MPGSHTNSPSELLDARLRHSTGLVAVLDRLADQLAEQRAWMNAQETAAFLGISYEDFTRIAHEVPRSPLPSARGQGVRPRYRYYAPRVTEWLLSR